jgi:hypothetical protein
VCVVRFVQHSHKRTYVCTPTSPRMYALTYAHLHTPTHEHTQYLKMGVDQLNVALAAYCALLSGTPNLSSLPLSLNLSLARAHALSLSRSLSLNLSVSITRSLSLALALALTLTCACAVPPSRALSRSLSFSFPLCSPDVALALAFA